MLVGQQGKDGFGGQWWTRNSLESKDKQAVSEISIWKRMVKQQKMQEAQGDDQWRAGKATGIVTSRKLLSTGKATCVRPQKSTGGGQNVELLSKSCSCVSMYPALERPGHAILCRRMCR